MKRKIFLIWLFFFLFLGSYAQDSSHVRNDFLKVGYITSGTLILSGIISNKDVTKNGFRDWVRKRFEVNKTSIDDYLQHAPIAMLFISDLAIARDKKDISRHTRHLLVSQGLTLGSVYILKAVVNNRRPNGGSKSFPSGHTAYSFASANVMYHSFKEDNLLLAYSGYLPAVITATYRIIKDKHWMSDVLAGAGIGILFSHISYQMDLWHCRTNKISHSAPPVRFTLGIGPEGIGMSAVF